MAKVSVEPGGDIIVSVRHGLGTKNVLVRCEKADGTPVGFVCAHVIDDEEVEVVLVPDSEVAVVYVDPGTPDLV